MTAPPPTQLPLSQLSQPQLAQSQPSSAPPHNEPPILVEYLRRLDHYHNDCSNKTAEERRPLAPTEVWLDVDLIPSTPPAQTPYPGTVSAVVSGISGVSLTPVAGDVYRFESLAGHLLDVVPANYNGWAYQPTLRDAAGKTVPYDPNVWVVDGVRRVVEFKYRTPQQLGYAPPFTIDYWRYVGAFPGGGGGLTGGVNLGGGAQVFKDVLGANMRFRTITAGPGLTEGQDLPVANEIQISADEVSPAGAPAVPTALDLYVSQVGNDVTGNGTAGAPYQTIGRAFRDIRVYGYNSTATVTILASGGPFVIPAGTLALGQGTRGARAQPIEIRGSGKTVVNAGLAVAAAAQDSPSGLLELSVAAPPATPFAIGQTVRFTSGPLASFSPTPPFAPIAVECFIAAVVNPTTIRLPFALGVPAAGNTFDVLTLDTAVTVTGNVIVRTARLPIIWKDMRLDLTPSAGTSTLIVAGSITGFIGVWIRNLAAFGQFINVAGQVAFGRAASVLTTITYTALGGLFDNTTPGNVLYRNPLDSQATIGLSNCVFRGNGQENNLVVNGSISGLNECYFGDIGSVTVTTDLTPGGNLWLEASHPPAGRGALEIEGGGTLAASGIRIGASAAAGIRVSESGFAVSNSVTITGCGEAGVLGQTGGQITTSNLVISGCAGPGIGLYDGARLVDTSGNLNLPGASSGSDGISLDRNASIEASGIACTGNSGVGVRALNGSFVTVTGLLDVSGNGGGGLYMSRASLTAGGTTASNCTGNGVFATNASDLTLGGALTASTNTAAGVLIQGRAQVSAGDTVLTNNGLAGLDVSGSASFTCGALSSSSNAQNGATIVDASLTASSCNIQNNTGRGADFRRAVCRVGGDFQTASNGGADQVRVDEESSVSIGGTLSSATAATVLAMFGGSDVSAGAFSSLNATGVSAFIRGSSRFVVTGAFTVLSNTSGFSAVFAGEGSYIKAESMSVTGGLARGIILESQSTLVTPLDITSSSNALDGISLSNSTLSCAGATCNANGGNGILVQHGSSFTSTAPLSCGLNIGHGFSIADGSRAVLSTLDSAAGANTGVGLSARTNSQVKTVVGNTMTGAGGNVVVGVNAVTTWANINTRAPAFVTDYLSAQPATELCSVIV